MRRNGEKQKVPQLSISLRLRDAIVDMQREMDAIAENGRRRRAVQQVNKQRGNRSSNG